MKRALALTAAAFVGLGLMLLMGFWPFVLICGGGAVLLRLYWSELT